MNPYQPFVDECRRNYRDAQEIPLGQLSSQSLHSPAPIAHDSLTPATALIFAPHPDDEGIIGALPIRLQREHGWQIKNVAVTLGSQLGRRKDRLSELRGACEYLGFELIVPDATGWENVTQKGREFDPTAWKPKVDTIATLIVREKPAALFFPHVDDWNGTHIGTHWLVMDALSQLGTLWSGYLVETEFWGQMQRPNLMVGVSASQLANQVAGVSFHIGEVQRNPFHLRLPAWMQDNVRRGSELVGGQGGAAPDLDFATLYRLRSWKAGQLMEVLPTGKSIGLEDQSIDLFPRL